MHKAACLHKEDAAVGKSFQKTNSTSGIPAPFNAVRVIIIGRPLTVWAELMVCRSRLDWILIGRGSHCLWRQPADQETAASDNTHNTHLLILLSQVVMAVHYYHALQTNSVFLPPGLVRGDRTA